MQQPHRQSNLPPNAPPKEKEAQDRQQREQEGRNTVSLSVSVIKTFLRPKARRIPTLMSSTKPSKAPAKFARIAARVVRTKTPLPRYSLAFLAWAAAPVRPRPRVCRKGILVIVVVFVVVFVVGDVLLSSIKERRFEREERSFI